MNRPCTIGGHAPAPGAARNQGLEFGRCRRCGRELVRSRGSWRTVPKGFRVVWRRGPPQSAEAPSAAQLLLDLPASGRALARPRPPERKRSRVAAAFELAVMAARCLAWATADRARAWLKSLRAPRMAPQPVFTLTAG